MNYSFHEEAETELLTAIEYYEECQPGLGLLFSEEFYATIDGFVKNHFPEFQT
jgi:hypothetical protein